MAVEAIDVKRKNSGKIYRIESVICLFVIFAVIWLYSVLDAYLTGRKLDQHGEGDRPRGPI